MTRLVIYSRPGCHLCDDMKALVQRVLQETSRADCTLEEIDIATSAELLSRYDTEIPVLTIDGRKAAKYRITETELSRVLRSCI
jgi:glutaredoxin